MRTGPDETARDLLALAMAFEKDVYLVGRIKAGDAALLACKYVQRDTEATALASELAEVKAALEMSQANAKMIAAAADRMRAHEKTQDEMLRAEKQRADAAEQRERELMGALEATTAELDEVAQLVRVGALASTVVRTATNAANRGKALIEAHRKAGGK